MSRQRFVFSFTVILSLSLSSNAVSSFMPSSFASSRMENKLTRRKDVACIRGGSSDISPNTVQTPDQPPTDPAPPSEPSPTMQTSMATTTPTPPSAVSNTAPIAAETAISSPIESAPTESLLGPNAKPAGTIRRTFPAFPWHKLPNYLTFMRCAAIPVFVYTFYQPNQHVATSLLFASASITDWFDGFLARRWDISSPFGAFLDPVADKLMVSTSLILLTGRYGLKLAIPTSIILAREIAVSALREWMATRCARDTVKVGMQGKVKTALTMTALTLLLAVPADGVGTLGKLLFPAELMIYASALVTVTSGSVYFRAAAPVLLSSKK